MFAKGAGVLSGSCLVPVFNAPSGGITPFE
jgi:hypothetical protein